MNYYEILEISEDASQEIIKAAYKTLAKKYHPDSYSNSNDVTSKNMSQINEAYEILSDVTKKASYDIEIQKSKNNSIYEKNDNCKDHNKKSNANNSLIKTFFNFVVETMQNNAREVDNAFISGLNMDEYTLVRKYRYAKGHERLGYAKALEEKGILERNDDGKFIPTYKFDWYK